MRQSERSDRTQPNCKTGLCGQGVLWLLVNLQTASSLALNIGTLHRNPNSQQDLSSRASWKKF